MAVRDWMQWYKTTSKLQDKQKDLQEQLAAMTPRERATAELILSQYTKRDEIFQQATKDLKKIDNAKTQAKLTNNIAKAVAQSLVDENAVANGLNLAGVVEQQKLDLAKLTKQANDAENKQARRRQNAVSFQTSTAIDQNDLETANLKSQLNDTFDKAEQSALQKMKSEITSELASKIITSAEQFDKIKSDLLVKVEQNKNDYGVDGYKQLIDYLDKQQFGVEQDNANSNIDNEVADLVTIFANNKQIYLNKNQYNLADAVSCPAYGRVGLIFGDLLVLNYDGEKYKGTAGAIITDEQKGVVNAICKSKKITPEVGTTIYYDRHLYVYSGSDIWRVAQNIGKPNDGKGIYGLEQILNQQSTGGSDNENK